MGGKSKAPAAPDYGPLVALSEKSANMSFEMATRQQDWAEKVYNENKEVSDIVIEKALGQLDQQTADAARARQRYQSLFEPLEEQLAYDAESYASPERQEKEAGAAEADVAQQFEQARETAAANLEQYGVNPADIRGQALDLGTRIAEAAAQSSAGNQARTQTENIGRALRSEAINVGRGYPGQIAAAAAGAGQAGNQAANTGLATTASGAQTMGTGMGWQGAGNQAVAGWGNLLNAGFANQMDRFNANQNASSGWGKAAGIAGSLLTTMLVQEGGAIPDPQGTMIPPEASASSGAIPDDVPAQIDGQAPAQLNAGEFVVPKDVVSWVGEKGMQTFVLKARKEMSDPTKAPAQPEMAQQPIPPDGIGAIPTPQGV
jgi:hypothetical protein